MRHIPLLLQLLWTICLGSTPAVPPALRAAEGIHPWKQLATLPDPEGFASPIAGVSHGALLVAGGANFPDKKPWEGGTKQWHDRIFLLTKPEGNWIEAGRLQSPIAYGVSVSYKHRIITAGGSNARGHVATVFSLENRRGKIVTEQLPPLPAPIANAAGTRVGNMLYVAGGTATADATTALATVFTLNLDRPGKGWKTTPAFPGTPRMLAAAAGDGRWFYWIGGVSLSSGSDGKPVRTYLSDAYRFSPETGWERLADLPTPLAAAASPALTGARGKLWIAGGDDGSLVGTPQKQHPGFSTGSLKFNPATGGWSEGLPIPASRVTLPLVEWRGMTVLVSGEMRPGVRSPQVWAVETGSLIE